MMMNWQKSWVERVWKRRVRTHLHHKPVTMYTMSQKKLQQSVQICRQSCSRITGPCRKLCLDKCKAILTSFSDVLNLHVLGGCAMQLAMTSPV